MNETINIATNNLRPIAEIVADLSKPVMWKHLKSRKQGGVDIFFLSWHNAAKYLDYYAPGWCYEIRHLDTIAGKLIITSRITIPCAEGFVFRESTGQEDEEVNSYGDSSSNAESMSFRRACAKFGLGLYLYEKDGYKRSQGIDSPPSTVSAAKQENAPKSQGNAGKAASSNATDEAKPEPKIESSDSIFSISPEQLKKLIELCENPPKRPEPFDKNKLAKFYSKGRTELLEDLTAAEALAAIDKVSTQTK